MLAFIDALDSREKAVVVWGIALLAFLAIQDDGDVRRSIVEVGRSLLHRKLFSMFVSAGVYTAVLLLAAYWLGIWHLTATKEVVYWYLSTAVFVMGQATTASPLDGALYAKLVRRALRFTLVAEFLVGLYVFPLAVEILIVVPVLAGFVTVQAFTAREGTFEAVNRLANRVLLVAGLVLMINVIVRAAIDPHGLFTREHGEELLVGPVLTILFIPYICALAWYCRREINNLRPQLS